MKMSNTFKIFVCPDANVGVENFVRTVETYADLVADVSLVVEGAVKKLLSGGVADLEVTPLLDEPGECFAVGFEWIYPDCKGHTHESYITGRLVQA